MRGVIAYVRREWLWLATNVAALALLGPLTWKWLTGTISPNPIDDFTAATGSATILTLLATLAVTPINTITGWRAVVGLRRTLGLYAFAYATLHLLVFVGLDYGFSLKYILADGLPKKRYIIVGFAALMILLPLAITSTKGWQKRLGRAWKKLHRWVYVAGLLGVAHYLWVSKVAYGKPVIYTGILALLLAARIPAVRSRLVQARNRLTGRRTAPARRAPRPAKVESMP
jgi:sulfoxide reductase heme-binding subunit YedZ